MSAGRDPSSRTPLPTDPWQLPPLDPGWDAALDEGLAALGLELGPGARRALEAHSRLLLAWTAAINLTAVREAAAVARLHLVDSLTAVPFLRTAAPAHPALLDLGSGGGLPGLPLGVVLPAARVALVDSIAKKARFLEVAARAAMAAMGGAASGGGPVPAVEAIVARAEDLAGRRAHRGAWDVVTARAVGSLAELVELGMPLARIGGLLVCWKRDDGSGALAGEVAAAAGIGRAVGGEAALVITHPESAVPGHRLVVVRKARATPERFPRPPAERRRAPLLP